MKRILLFLILLPLISGICEENQIDINSASLEDLDKLVGIGPVKAQAIIDTRPFKSLNNLIDVNGIGEATLEDIINQDLACVDTSEDIEETEYIEDGEEIEEMTLEEKEETIKTQGSIVDSENLYLEKEEKTIPEVIHLNPQNIKTDNSKENKERIDYSKYLIILFCLILGGFYLIKPGKKNEWK